LRRNIVRPPSRRQHPCDPARSAAGPLAFSISRTVSLRDTVYRQLGLQVTVSTEVRNFSAAPCQAMAFFLHAPSAKSLATYLSPKLYRALRFANGFRALELSVVFRAASTSPMPVINFFGVTATGVHPYPIVYSALAIEEKTCTSVWRACEVVVNEGANYKPPVILRIPELKFLLDLSGWLEGRRSRLCVETCGCRRNVRGCCGKMHDPHPSSAIPGAHSTSAIDTRLTAEADDWFRLVIVWGCRGRKG